MAQYLILDVTREVNGKTNESFFVMQVFGNVQKFGKVSKQAITIRLKSNNDFTFYQSLIGETIDLDIVLPHSDYSYSLADSSSSENVVGFGGTVVPPNTKKDK